MERQRVTSGSEYEERIGFSRAVRVGDRVFVSGTAPILADGSCDRDAAAQARRCIQIILDALADVGASADDVVRTRTYLVDPEDAWSVGQIHAVAFGDVRPAATMVVVARLLDERWRVEMEAEAVVAAPTMAS